MGVGDDGFDKKWGASLSGLVDEANTRSRDLEVGSPSFSSIVSLYSTKVKRIPKLGLVVKHALASSLVYS